jgi:hypothetical protein
MEQNMPVTTRRAALEALTDADTVVICGLLIKHIDDLTATIATNDYFAGWQPKLSEAKETYARVMAVRVAS